MIFFENLAHILPQGVADACRENGDVIVDVAACGGMAAALAEHGTPQAVVMTPPTLCEATALKAGLTARDEAMAFGAQLQASAMQFLSDCRLVTQAMMPLKAGQILFLGIDDVAARLVGLHESPIANQMRIAALKSLAKEYGRMGLKFNAILSQPSKETVAPAVWREKREALKVYTMRFTPPEVAEIAGFCRQALTGPMPVNGGVLCLGKGVMEMAA